jgi:hypothetical protein
LKFSADLVLRYLDVFGWKDNSLQRAMDEGCYLRNCSLLTEQAPKIKNECNVPVTVDEDVDGCK